MFSTGSRIAIPSGNLLFTSSSPLRTLFLCSGDLRSVGKKILRWPIASTVESKTGTTSILPFSPATGGRTPGGSSSLFLLAGTLLSCVRSNTGGVLELVETSLKHKLSTSRHLNEFRWGDPTLGNTVELAYTGEDDSLGRHV
ncbi:hypothetical protein KCV06_g241, partial [Aureobasidium melanogenum]